VADNAAGLFGGGVGLMWGATGSIHTCTFYGNSANGGTRSRGGAVEIGSGSGADLQGCTITRNSAGSTLFGYGGGGVSLYNTLDPATSGKATLRNSIVYGNTCAVGGDLYCGSRGTLHGSHNDVGEIYGTPASWTAAMNADPMFENPAADDFHLTSDSPCIDAGLMTDEPGEDMDGDTRPQGTGIDVGADEYADTDADGEPDHADADDDNDGLPDSWEAAHGLDSLSDDSRLDADGDGMDNRSEYIADTNPTSAESRLAITGVCAGRGGVTIHWRGGQQAMQILETCTSLTGPWTPVCTNEPPTAMANSHLVARGPEKARFFRVRAVRADL
jgi:hypothetical protein